MMHNAYSYMSTCPKCGHREDKGISNRPDVLFDDCLKCGYRGPLELEVKSTYDPDFTYEATHKILKEIGYDF